MKFKNWKEAEKRANELKAEIEKVNNDIATMEAEARNEETEVGRRDTVITDIETKTESRNKMQTEYDEAIREQEELKATEERQLGLLNNLSKNNIDERNKEMDKEKRSVYETTEYRNAWIEAVKAGDKEIVKRFLNTQNATEGQVLIPTELSNVLNDAIMQGGRILNLCNISTIPAVVEEAIIEEKSDPDTHKETGTNKKKEKKIKTGIVKLDPEYIAEILPVTRKFESLSNTAFWDWLKRELPDALLRKIDNLIIAAEQTAGNGIKGITTNTNGKLVIIISSNLDFNTGNKAMGELSDGVEDNTTVIMNRKTFFNNVMGLTDTTGKPIYQILTDNTGKPAYFFGGQPVKFNSEMKAYDEATTGEAYMVVGDFKGYRVNLPNGLEPEITRDATTRKDENIVEYLSEILAAGDVAKTKCFAVVKKV